MSADDFGALMSAGTHVDRWRAERENATARLDLAMQQRSIAHLLSQHEPVHSLGIDREKLRVLLNFVRHHDVARMNREIAEKFGVTPT